MIQVRVQLPQLELFQMDPLPKVLPKRERKKPNKGCPECGAGTDISGYLCGDCRGPRRIEERSQGYVWEATGDDIPY